MKGLIFEIDEGRLLSYAGTGSVVQIPEGVGSVGPRVFYAHKEIERVIFPESLKIIEESAFFGCSSLSSIIFSTGLKVIENHAFASCQALRELILPEGLEIIEQSAFSPCASLVRLVLPSSLKELGEFAFSCCRQLKEVQLPDQLERIDRSAFSMCSSLIWITLPEALKELVRGVFLGCTSLKDVNLKENISDVENNAFQGCSSLLRVNVSEANPFLKSVDGVLYSRDGRCLKYFPGGRLEISIPEGTIEVGKEAFYENRNFDRISLPESLEAIGDCAFYRCSELIETDLPQGLKRIGSQAFEGCAKIKSLQIPDSVREIGESAFRNCRSFMWLKLPQDMAFDLHWFSAPHDPPCFSADHTIIPFVTTRPFADISSEIGTRRAALGFIQAENEGIHTDAYLEASYIDYIRSGITGFYEDMLEDDDILRWLCERKLIPQSDVERLLERASDSGRASASAQLLNYQNKNRPGIVPEQLALKGDVPDGSDALKTPERISSREQMQQRFDALDSALDF